MPLVGFLCGVYTFSKEDYFVNPSCVDPCHLGTWRVSMASKNLGLMIRKLSLNDLQYAMCVSIIHVSKCHLLVPCYFYTADGSGIRLIEGDFLVQEFERLLGCLGVVYCTSSFTFNLFSSHFQFHTYVDKRWEDDSEDNVGSTFVCLDQWQQQLLISNVRLPSR